MIGLACIILFLGLILLRVPVCASLGIATFSGMLAGGYPLSMTIMSLQSTLESVNYLPIIFFILMGNIANSAELSERIFKFATDMVGHLRGGLAQANVLASMVFAGMSGSGIADCAGLGIVEMKAMTDFGYRRSFSAAVTAASAVVGPIIPPSISLVIFGVLANVSITRVLLGGLVPGLFIGLVLMVLIYFLTASGRAHAPVTQKLSVKEKASSFGRNFSALLAPVILLSGFVLGAVSPSEAGGLAILYILLLAAFRRKISFRKVFNEGVLKSIVTISQVMFILALASALGWLLAREQVYIFLAEVIQSFCGESALMFWLVVNVFYLLNGCFVPGIATMVITVPLFAPLLPFYGIDPIQFGIVIIFNDMIGMITPPVGSGLFVMLSVGKVRYDQLVKDLLPFVFVLLLALLVLVLVPQITLFFPNLILGPAGGGP